MVSINELLKKSTLVARESILILSHLLGVDKAYIFTYGEREVDRKNAEEFLKLVDKRGRGYPLHYILGSREFMGLDFILEDGVLIPRPDTEILVEYIVEYVEKGYIDKEVNILDIGYGSGAIALSLGHYLKNARVYGVDISPTAYRLAKKNKEKLNIGNVELYLGDLFDLFSGAKYKEFFHIIVSNPPYIERDILETLDREVRDFEPRVALDGGEDGLDFYRKISCQAKSFLASKGLLAYEIGFDQGTAVRDIMASNHFRDMEIIKDLQRHDRVVIGFK